MQVALLLRESANRVYASATPGLAIGELTAIAGSLTTSIGPAEVMVIGGVDYVVFECDDLDGDDRFVLSNLSTVRALYERRADGSLRPLDLVPFECFDSDLVTIQRYPGKTNEQFTHLLVNVAVAASTSATRRNDGRVRLLDPVAGRGSTLNRALTHGFDAAGIELVDADADQYRTFLGTYLKEHRIKHKLTSERIRQGPLAGTSRWRATIRGVQTVDFARSDAALAVELFGERRFDAIVGDLPYGVQHRATAAARHRSPAELLDHCLHAWHTVMRPGASIALSWNLKTLPRQELVARLDAAGLAVVDHAASFEHVVDRSITRDLVVAVR